MSYVAPVMERNFLEYASYVIVDRAIPELRDGCKPVQRRILYTLSEIDDGRFHKVANVIGETMKLHPHGDASIGEALVNLANKEYFIERQGNFGNVLTGHPAAAPRYIECRLTPLARETLFNKRLTEFQPSYDGRKDEPVALPVKLPVVLMLGAEGIAVGMSTRIFPHNLGELWRAQVDHLLGKEVELLPDFAQGGTMDVSEYDDGAGKIRLRAKLEAAKDNKSVTIREIPASTTTESLIASIEAATQKGKLKIASIEDRTAENVEIVLHLRRGAYAEELIPQLYAHTHCEVALTASYVVIRDRRPVEMRTSEILKELTAELKTTLKRELELELGDLQDREHFLTLEQIFIENRVYKKIENAATEAAVKKAVYEGMRPFARQMVRELTDDDVDRLLEIRIRRISAYDIEKNRKAIDEVVKKIAVCKRKLSNMKKTTIAYLDDLIDRFADEHPRRTEIEAFESVDIREVAVANLRVSLDSKTGFFGTDVKGDAFDLTVSEFDKIIAVSSDGTFRIMSPPQKVLLPGKVLHVGLFDDEEGAVFTVVYRTKGREAFAKKVHVKSYIRDKEYSMIKGEGSKVDRLFVGETDAKVHMYYVPAKYQRVHEGTFDLGELDVSGLGARGTRMAPKPVARIKILDA